jgi:hypothetical protein
MQASRVDLHRVAPLLRLTLSYQAPIRNTDRLQLLQLLSLQAVELVQRVRVLQRRRTTPIQEPVEHRVKKNAPQRMLGSQGGEA